FFHAQPADQAPWAIRNVVTCDWATTGAAAVEETSPTPAAFNKSRRFMTCLLLEPTFHSGSSRRNARDFVERDFMECQQRALLCFDVCRPNDPGPLFGVASQKLPKLSRRTRS